MTRKTQLPVAYQPATASSTADTQSATASKPSDDAGPIEKGSLSCIPNNPATSMAQQPSVREIDFPEVKPHLTSNIVQVAIDQPTQDRTIPSLVPVENTPIAEVNLESDKPYNIMPLVPVPSCANPLPQPPGTSVYSTEDTLGWDSEHMYIQRWVRMCKEEENQTVRFQVVRNDSTPDTLLLLLALKNVFLKQLPNMPKTYVVRLVFDINHESLLILKRSGKEHVVIGGCCYRPFIEQKYGEIAFFAISKSEQVHGYGGRLMAHIKERAKTIGLKYLLTCADNNAVAYFMKQGFSKKVTLPPDIWQGAIKDYEGVALMECIIHDSIDFLNIPMTLKAQKMSLVEKLREVSYSHVVFPGIDFDDKKEIKIENIPGLEGLEWDTNGSSSASSRSGPGSSSSARGIMSQQQLHNHLLEVLKDIKAHDCAEPFLEPVNPEESGAIDYYDVIKNPMDLSTIQKRLDKIYFYRTKEMFIADMLRIVKNSKIYNGESHGVTKMALKIEKLLMNKI